MPTNDQPPRRDQEPSGIGIAAAGISTAILMVVCCAGPAMITAGALGALGGLLGNPWVIAAAAVALVAAVIGVTAAIRRRREGRDACCPPNGSRKTSTDRDHVPKVDLG